jgi:hypothetical protein
MKELFGPAIDHTDQQRFAALEAAYPGERELLLVAEDNGSVAGADAEAGFYVRHGYRTMLLLQWAYDPGRFDAEVEALAAGPVKGMEWHRNSFGGVPQLLVDLDEPSPVVRAQVQDLVRRGRSAAQAARRRRARTGTASR